jgi:hypothetical protein
LASDEVTAVSEQTVFALFLIYIKRVLGIPMDIRVSVRTIAWVNDAGFARSAPGCFFQGGRVYGLF